MPPTAIREGHLFIDPPAPGAWNMAVDEVLLEDADRGQLSMRFYAWTPTTLSLGYFQHFRQRDEHTASGHCPVVRRPSGGGAIVHDDEAHELTYSIALPGVNRARATQQWLYDTLHGSLIDALSQWSIVARRCARHERAAQPEPFLCFQRHTLGDVLVEGHKVAGSAQRRSATAVLQHGSVLLSRSTAAPELPGISQLSGIAVSSAKIRSAWLETLQRRWPVAWLDVSLSAEQRRRATERSVTKFAQRRWNERR